MGWAPALDLRALTVLYIKEEPKKVHKLLWDSHFPSLVSAIRHRITLTLAGEEVSGSCAWAPLLQQQCGHSGFYLRLLDAV